MFYGTLNTFRHRNAHRLSPDTQMLCNFNPSVHRGTRHLANRAVPGTRHGQIAAARRPSQDNRHMSHMRIRTATFDTPEGASVSQAPAPHIWDETAKGTFRWTKQWWPVFPVFQLDKRKPHPVTMLGKDYVIWWDEAARQWSLLEDRCPHRLAALSAGRIVDGKLTCSYHGWQFNGKGSCVAISQIGDSRAAKAALSSPRTCVTSFPTRVEDGLLFAWLGEGPDAADEAKAAERSMVMQQVVGSAGGDWYCRTTPVDYSRWLEQGMDPSHAEWAHPQQFQQGVRAHVEAKPVRDGYSIDGFQWEHGRYVGDKARVKAKLEFKAPHTTMTSYHVPFVMYFQVMDVPVRPGVSRIFFKLPSRADRLTTLAKRLLPPGMQHVLLAQDNEMTVDQDVAVMGSQQARMHKCGMTRRDYVLFSSADFGIVAIDKWLKDAGYEAMWVERMPQSIAADWSSITVDQQMDLWERHAKDCAVCQKEYGNLTLYSNILGGVAIAPAIAAVAPMTDLLHGRGLTSASLAAIGVAMSGACFWARSKIQDVRDGCIVSSSQRWRKVGGLSMVKGVPIKL